MNINQSATVTMKTQPNQASTQVVDGLCQQNLKESIATQRHSTATLIKNRPQAIDNLGKDSPEITALSRQQSQMRSKYRPRHQKKEDMSKGM